MVDAIDIARWDDAGAGTTEITITDVTITGTATGPDFGIVVQDRDETGSDQILISGNVLTGCQKNGIGLYGSDSATITGNKISDGGTQSSYGAGIYITTAVGSEYPTDITVSKNIVDNMNNFLVTTGATGKEITGVKVWNNSAVNLYGNSIQSLGYTTFSEIYNNIFSGIAAAHSFFNIDTNSSITAVNYNRYYDDADIRWTYHGSVPTDIATWRTLISDDGDSAVADPLLNGDYRPATLIPGTDVGLTTDYNGMFQPTPWTGAVGEDTRSEGLSISGMEMQ